MSNQPKPKSKKKPLVIVGIISVVFLVGMTIAAAAFRIYKSSTKTDTTKTTSSSTTKTDTTTTDDDTDDTDTPTYNFTDLDLPEGSTVAFSEISGQSGWNSSDNNTEQTKTYVYGQNSCQISTIVSETESKDVDQQTSTEKAEDTVVKIITAQMSGLESEEIGSTTFPIESSAVDAKTLDFFGRRLTYLGKNKVDYTVNVWGRSLPDYELFVYQSCPSGVWSDNQTLINDFSKNIKLVIK